MKLTRKIVLLSLSVLIIPFFLWLNHEHKARLLVGNWKIVEKGKIYQKSNPILYYIFHSDGTGQEIGEWRGKKGVMPFKYKFTGLSSLEITEEYGFYGTEVVSISDKRLREAQNMRVNIFNITFSSDGEKMYFDPHESNSEKRSIYAIRLNSSPSPKKSN